MTTALNLPQKLEGLGYFTGTDTWWKNPLFPGFTYTDGCKHVFETANAYWLLDVVLSHAKHTLKPSQLGFLVCKLERTPEGNAAEFTICDDDKNVLASQSIPFTDFPAMEQTFWLVDTVLMLPSEY